jgi:hypothetical protein
MAEEIVFKTTVDTGNSVSAINDVDKALKEVNSTVKSNSVDSNKAFDELNAKVDSGELSVRQLSRAVKEYATIAVQAGEDSPIGQEAIRRAGELKDRLGDLQTQINNNANDGRSMQTALQLGQGIAAGYAVAQGAMALFGNENKDLQKTLIKLQAIQAVLAGLEEIRAILEKESLVRSAAIKTWNVIKTVSEYAYATAVGVTTGALKLARLAMLALPIFLVIAGITAIASAMSSFGSSTESTEEKQKRLDAALAATNKTLDAQKLAYENAATASKWASDKQLVDALNAGASEKELTAIKLKASKDNLAILKDSYEKSKKYATSIYGGKTTQAQWDAALAARNEAYNKYSTELMSIDMASAEAKNATITAAQAKQDEANKKSQEKARDNQKKAEEKKKEEIQKQLEQEKARLSNILKLEQEFRQEYDKAETDYYDSLLSKRDKEKQDVNDYYFELIAKAKNRNLDVTALEEAQAAKIKQIDDEIKIEKDAKEKEEKDKKDEFYKNYQQTINTAQENEINGVNEKYDALIKTAEQYGLDTVELEIKRQEALAKIEEDAAVKKIDNVKKYADATMSSLNALNDLQNQLDANKLKNQNLTESQVLEIKKKAFNRDKALKIASVSINTAEAISKSVAASPTTFGAPFSIFAGVTGLAQIAAIASTKFDGGGGNIAAPAAPSNDTQGGGGGFGVGSNSEVSSVGLTDNATGIKVTVVDSEIKAVMDASAAASVLSTFGG